MQTTRQRIEDTNQHCHNARHFSQFELRMGERLPKQLSSGKQLTLVGRLLINENYDMLRVSVCIILCIYRRQKWNIQIMETGTRRG